MPHIGLLFGSFNPIHIGHLALANYMREVQGMDQVWLVVSPQNPFKDTSQLIDSHHRLQMAAIALAGQPHYKVCDIEMTMPVPSYTIDTLRALDAQYPGTQFSLIMGSDIIQTIAQWRNSADIVNHYHLYVYPRPGYPMPHTGEMPSNYVLTQAPMIDVSSTFIRQQISMGRDMRFYLPAGVGQYISEQGIY